MARCSANPVLLGDVAASVGAIGALALGLAIPGLESLAEHCAVLHHLGDGLAVDGLAQDKLARGPLGLGRGVRGSRLRRRTRRGVRPNRRKPVCVPRDIDLLDDTAQGRLALTKPSGPLGPLLKVTGLQPAQALAWRHSFHSPLGPVVVCHHDVQGDRRKLGGVRPQDGLPLSVETRREGLWWVDSRHCIRQEERKKLVQVGPRITVGGLLLIGLLREEIVAKLPLLLGGSELELEALDLPDTEHAQHALGHFPTHPAESAIRRMDFRGKPQLVPDPELRLGIAKLALPQHGVQVTLGHPGLVALKLGIVCLQGGPRPAEAGDLDLLVIFQVDFSKEALNAGLIREEEAELLEVLQVGLKQQLHHLRIEVEVLPERPERGLGVLALLRNQL